MDVTVPSGHKVVIRDQFMRADRKEGERGLVVVVQPDGTRRIEGNALTRICTLLLCRLIVSWDYDFPPPHTAGSDPLREAILDRLDDDDASALERIVAPYANRIVTRQSASTEYMHLPTGVQVMVLSPADAQKLAAHPDFQSADGAETADGPKPAPSATAISSSESPAADGQTSQE